MKCDNDGKMCSIMTKLMVLNGHACPTMISYMDMMVHIWPSWDKTRDNGAQRNPSVDIRIHRNADSSTSFNYNRIHIKIISFDCN